MLRTLTPLVLLGSVVAQPVPVPAGTIDRDSPSLGPIAGFCASHRQQILVDARHLQALVGRQLRGLWFRRDGFFPADLPPADADLTISLSQTATRAEAPSEVFAANRGAAVVQVFQGRVSLPASPALGERYVPWESPHAVNIPFTTPFAYAGGNLCIEIDGQQVPGSPCFRPFDYEWEGQVGVATKYGIACGKYAGRFGISATVTASNLRLATTASFYSWGQPNTSGAMMIGDQKYFPGIDLDVLGATDCDLYVRSTIMIPAAFGSPFRAGEPGTAKVAFQIPPTATLMGAMLWVQWANVEVSLPRAEWSNPLGLTTSNGLEVTISSFPPALGMATVLSDIAYGGVFPSRGRTNVTKAPALRFDS